MSLLYWYIIIWGRDTIKHWIFVVSTYFALFFATVSHQKWNITRNTYFRIYETGKFYKIQVAKYEFPTKLQELIFAKIIHFTVPWILYFSRYIICLIQAHRTFLALQSWTIIVSSIESKIYDIRSIFYFMPFFIISR